MALQQPMVGKVPTTTPITSVLANGWRLVQTWLQFFTQIKNGINASALVMAIVTGTGSGSLGPTIFMLPVLTTGLYRISVFMQVTRAASVSSSLTPKVSFTNASAGGPINSVETGAAMTSNNSAAPLSVDFLIQVASSTSISWELDYVSSGVQTMAFQFAWSVEQVPTPMNT